MTLTYNDTAMQIRTAELHERLCRAIEHATTAPSGHNTQPWKFRLLRDGVELYADRTRSLPVVDPKNREQTISCGAALYCLRLAMNCDGLATLIRVLPDPDQPDLLARVIVSGPYAAKDDQRALFAAMPRRRTNRSPFKSDPVDASLYDHWYLDAKAEKCWIHVIDSVDKKHEIADLITEGDRLQGRDKAFRHELAKWMRVNNSSAGDGMPGFSHAMGDLASFVGPLVIRTFDWGDGQAAKDRQLAEGSPLLMVIGTQRDTPDAWMECGQALSRILLRGTAEGLAASYLNQAIEVAALRSRLSESIKCDGYPQLLLRWGYGPEVKSTPRRPISEVIQVDR